MSDEETGYATFQLPDGIGLSRVEIPDEPELTIALWLSLEGQQTGFAISAHDAHTLHAMLEALLYPGRVS